MATYYSTMRDANVARGIEWSNGAKDGTLFYAIELFGEAGEALNVVKKLERQRLGMVGSRATVQDLADELADVVICLDLLAIAYDRPPLERGAWFHDFKGQPDLDVALSLANWVGRVTGWVESLELRKWLRGEYGSEYLSNFDHNLQMALMVAVGLLAKFNVDLSTAVVSKFNKTSAKYGLTTMMAETAEII